MPQSPVAAHHFLLRRLHSLSGIVPIGVFLLVHLTTNSSMVWGGLTDKPGETIEERGVYYFQDEVNWIHNNIPHLLIIEITLWVSIAFHSILGCYYAFSGKRNTERYAYQGNWRYTLQRWSGYIGIVFVFYHVATLRWGWTWLVPGGAKWGAEYATSTLIEALKGSPDGITLGGWFVALLYFGGVSMLVFHFANGLWTAAITWGLTISEHAQRRWGYVCAGLGVGMMGMAWSSLIAVYFIFDQETAEKVEQKMLDKQSEALVEPAAETDAEVSELVPEASEPAAFRLQLSEERLQTAS